MLNGLKLIVLCFFSQSICTTVCSFIIRGWFHSKLHFLCKRTQRAFG